MLDFFNFVDLLLIQQGALLHDLVVFSSGLLEGTAKEKRK